MSCHFLARPGIDAETIHALLLAQDGVHLLEHDQPTRCYLDTFDQRLGAAGLVLEADVTGDERPRLSLRPRGSEQAEQVICGTTLPRFARDCLRPRLRDRLARLTAGRALLPVCLGPLEIRRYDCRDLHGKVVARLALETMPDAAPLLRLGAVAGFEAETARLARRLGRAGRLRPLKQDCATHLLAAQDLTPAPFTAKPQVVLRPTLGAGRALARLLRAYTDTLRATEAGIVADLDSEFLHDYRVALRSIRSWLSSLRAAVDGPTRERFRGELAELNRATGALRDLDVLEEKLDGYLAACGDAPAESAPQLRARITAAREAARTALVDHLQSQAYAAAMAGWSAFLDELARGQHAGRRGRQPIRDVVLRALDQRLAAVMDFDPEAARRDPHQLHELRKHCKKLRYLLEGFHSLFDPQALQAAVLELKGLQAAMGDTWDLFVHHGLLQRLAQDAVAQEHGDVGAQVLIETLETRLSALEQAHVVLVNRAFMRFRGPRVQRLYARLQEAPP